MITEIPPQLRSESPAVTARAFGSVAAVAAVADDVLIDEGQDLSPSQRKLLRALARPGRNDLFIAEDAHQRIYGHPVMLARCGVAIVGRSRSLTLNYRTTAENLIFAVRSLESGHFFDAEGDAADVVGYRSARRGPAPILIGAQNDKAQLDEVCDLVGRWIGDDTVEAGTVAILARTNARALTVRDALVSRGIAVNYVKSAQPSNDRVMTLTMHTSKGMEFSRVVLFDISDGVVPNQWALDHASPEEREEVMLQERSLLHVAASRARDALAVTWSGAPSPLLHASTHDGSSTEQEPSVVAL